MTAFRAVSGSPCPAPDRVLIVLPFPLTACLPHHSDETALRLNLVGAWRDANVFTDAERAALELGEQGTRIADAAGGVTDEAWANAAKHYDSDQLAALVCLIAGINTWNRLNVISRNQGGDYQPGQWG